MQDLLLLLENSTLYLCLSYFATFHDQVHKREAKIENSDPPVFQPSALHELHLPCVCGYSFKMLVIFHRTQTMSRWK